MSRSIAAEPDNLKNLFVCQTEHPKSPKAGRFKTRGSSHQHGTVKCACSREQHCKRWKREKENDRTECESKYVYSLDGHELSG